MRAFAARLAAVASSCLTLLGVAVPAGVAHAEDMTTIERPAMYFGVVFEAGYHDVCANGILRQPPSPAPVWDFDVVGSRLPGGTLILDGRSTTAQNAFLCVRVSKLGNAYGTYTATFTYHALPSDPPSVIVAQFAWYPGTNGEFVGIDQ